RHRRARPQRRARDPEGLPQRPAEEPQGGGVSAGPRRIGPLLATVLVAGNMIGSGIYLLPASMAAIGGISVIGWAICAAGALAIAGVFAFLAVVRPGVDGIVTYAGEGLHPVFGFMSWAAYYVSGWVGNVAVALAAVGYMAVFFHGLAVPLTGLIAAIALTWVLAGANLIGPRLTAAFGGVALASVVYIAANVAVLGVLPAAQLAASTAPFADVVARLAGWGAGAVVAVCATLKASGTLAGWILVTAESGRAGAASGFL